jgi:glycerol-3-phosphate cytidylyltransferase-like family protein
MGALALATAHYAEELAKVEERNAAAAKAATEAAARAAQLKDAEYELAIATAQASGAITEEEAAIMQRTAAVREAFSAQREYAEAQLASAEASLKAGGTDLSLVAVRNKAFATLEALNEREGQAVATAQELVEAKNREARAQKAATAAAQAKADAAREAEEAERAHLAATQAYTASVVGYADGIRELQAAQLATATEEERIIAAGEERLRQLDELSLKTRYLALTSEEAAAVEVQAEAARAAARQATAAQLDAIEQDAFEKRMAMLDEERTKREEADAAIIETQREAVTQGMALVSEALASSADNQAEVLANLEAQLAAGEDSMTQSQKQALKERIAAQRQAAMQAFEINKIAKLAEATINTAAAITQALASAPPPANLIAAGIAGAAGATQVAAIAGAQPAFHSGGMVPDEVPARLVTGEAVLSRVGRSMIGDEQIRAANAGMAPPTKVVAINQYRHQVFRPFIRDHLRMGGDLTDTIRGTRTVGMREAL